MVASLSTGCFLEGEPPQFYGPPFYCDNHSCSSSSSSFDPSSVGDDLPPPPDDTGGPPRNLDLVCSDNLLGDPGFEQPSPTPNWVETTGVFPTIICDESCSPTDGAGPHGGTGWAWFGGHGEMETATLSQPVTLDGTVATLSFFFSINRASIDNNGVFAVYLDDTQLFAQNDGVVGGYQHIELDISDFADGLTHMLRFESVFSGTAITNFFVDDVTLQTCAPSGSSGVERTDPSTGTGNETGTGGGTETDAGTTGSSSDAATGTGDASSVGSEGESSAAADAPS